MTADPADAMAFITGMVEGLATREDVSGRTRLDMLHTLELAIMQQRHALVQRIVAGNVDYGAPDRVPA